jgi:hypothetical protein
MRKSGMMVEKSPSACNDFLLLGRGHTGGRTAEVLAVAQPHFDKDEQGILLHHQVDFALAAAVVGGDAAEAGRLEMATRRGLSGGSRR